MNSSLLPVGSSELEIAAAKACAELSRTPIPLRQLCAPDTCPSSLLPYLAWAFSVDRWDEKWPEIIKRQAIKDAYFIHRHKGTIGALRRVVEPFGYLIRIIEWWQNGDKPGTFRLDIGVQDSGITEETFFELERLIADAKPASRHLLGLNINLDTQGAAYVAALSYGGGELTVYPYFPETITVSGLNVTGATLHLIDNVSVTA
ncbi:phage tail protein I [Pectobacterium brasiliense]|uniref:phage tail protein I n=1 Tax=Pectobacterium brasiliense TaxID=180957 RepID=UPI001CE17359|nr:phage tail protein I [Pectobacterium brasiliense]MCA5919225.1 phage tail protein I [Pectobacterium brasiliense]MCA5926388.1 phage tail protein I [Pectobacterium brasiliense]MCA5935596.1 phage tail protein I [Pectobacterium brasiliense]MCA5941527.1 phage tail protein I [Pectobacterium brasiliense]MCA5943209.1 phage tail protein I [Pectobacterium brasiliense]